MNGVRDVIRLIPICLLWSLVQGADIGGIQGTVFDAETGDALPYVNVIVEGTTLGAASDSLGRFFIPRVPRGEQRLIVTMMGYEPVTRSLRIRAEELVEIDVWLRSSPMSTGTIVVTGTRTPRFIKDVPVRTEVITSLSIEEKGACNLYEALEGTPGIRVEQQCQACNFSMLRLQGLGPDHTQVLMDGQPVYSGLASVYGLQQIGTSDIERIEVVKGAGSALYGSQAVAGAVNIITKDATLYPRGEMGIELGSHGDRRFDLTGSTSQDNVGVILSAAKNTNPAVDETRDGLTSDEVRGTDGVTDRVKTDVTNVGFTLTAKEMVGGDRLTFRGKGLHELRQGGLLDMDTYENPFTAGTERIMTDRYQGDISYTKGFPGGNEIKFSFSGSHHERNATNDSFLSDYMATHNDSLPPLDLMRPYLAKENLYVANLGYMQPMFGRHRVLLGAQLSHNRLEESGKYVTVDEEDPNYGVPYTSTSEKHAIDVGVYLQDEFTLSDALEVVAGVRLDHHQSEDEFRGSGSVAPEGVEPVKYDETSVNPRVAIKVKPSSMLTLRASAGTGFRVPFGFSEDLHLCSGSPRVWKGAALEPERSTSYSISADVAWDRVAMGVNVFRTDLKDAIGFVEAGDMARNLGYTYEWKNIDDAYVQGIELDVDVALSRTIGLGVNFSWNDGQYETAREDWIGTPYEESSRHISRFPKTAGGAKLEISPGDFRLTLDAKYQGPMYIDYFLDGETPKKIKETEPHVLLNVRMSQRFLTFMSVELGVRNLTDYVQPEKHTDDAAFIYAPVYGRQFYGGVEISLGE
jgi:outer membrane receptor for ferrienterochelin and colicins